ncbi:glycosyltransferase family 39 protein [Candidatus Woesebacteria bacterium]|nr:MAG: glycosyltransferase family 39 protein [Candidatus Woesebacteria bacterium]
MIKSQKLRNIRLYTLFIFVLVFILGLVTLPHYGINWDTINHLPRGQAYLNYFLTGSRDFSNLPTFTKYWQDPDKLAFSPIDKSREDVARVSLYQNAGVDFNYFMENDGGHPPASDIISSLFNYFLFQKWGIINDIDSYRVYSILLFSMSVAFLFYWISDTTNSYLAGFISALTLLSYPLYWSEAHFNNEKDIPEAVYILLTLMLVWYGVLRKKKRLLLIAGITSGLALGTKFNAFFLPFIVLPWMILLLYPRRSEIKKILLQNKTLIMTLFCIPILALFIFIALWPFLWLDPLSNIKTVLNFYHEIGLTDSFDKRFIAFGGINLYPMLWIVFSTPIIVLILSALGLTKAICDLRNRNNGFYFLVVLWLIVPIARVTAPGTNIYGGVRQIMEYVAPLSILCGIGALTIYNLVSKQKILRSLFWIVLISGYTFHIFRLISLHPNENVYFNSLIGGHIGARSINFPAAGNSFGVAYREGISWINKSTPHGTKLAYARELIPNIPLIWIRPDIRLSNSYRSGILQEGEYIIALTYQGTELTSFHDRYLNLGLHPIYSIDVDGASILKVWENTAKYRTEKYSSISDYYGFTYEYSDQGFVVDLGKIVDLAKISISYDDARCLDIEHGYVQISTDNTNWQRLPGTMPKEDWSVPLMGFYPTDKNIVIPFIGNETRFARIVMSPIDQCLSTIDKVEVKIYK